MTTVAKEPDDHDRIRCDEGGLKSDSEDDQQKAATGQGWVYSKEHSQREVSR